MAAEAIANTTFHSANPDGGTWTFKDGQRVEADHPAVQIHGWAFDLAEVEDSPKRTRTRKDTPGETSKR